jgi:hypothetical protein
MSGPKDEKEQAATHRYYAKIFGVLALVLCLELWLEFISLKRDQR